MTVKVKLPFSHFFPPTHSLKLCLSSLGRCGVRSLVRWFVRSLRRCGWRSLLWRLFVRWFVRFVCLFVLFVRSFVRSLAHLFVVGGWLNARALGWVVWIGSESDGVGLCGLPSLARGRHSLMALLVSMHVQTVLAVRHPHDTTQRTLRPRGHAAVNDLLWTTALWFQSGFTQVAIWICSEQHTHTGCGGSTLAVAVAVQLQLSTLHVPCPAVGVTQLPS